MKICPYCEGDGVWLIRSNRLGGAFAMCLECDTVWPDPSDVTDQSGQNFEAFCEQRGTEASWDDLEKLHYID